MRKIFIFILAIFAINSVFAYTGNSSDYKKIVLITNKIEKIISNKGETYRNKFISALKKYKENKIEKIQYLIENTINELDSKNFYKVIEVIDGDTIKVFYNGTGTTVRILGLDTPEKYTTRTGYKECYGDEASDFVNKTLSGKEVNLVFDYTQDKFDKYGRLLAHIKLQDGTLLQNLVIKNGYGFYYLYNIPTKFDEDFKKSQEEAKFNNIGVWKYCEGKRKPIEENNITNTGVIIQEIPIINNYSCNIKKTYCTEMKTCEEAKFYLNSCGLTRLDANSDGVPCESLCQ